MAAPIMDYIQYINNLPICDATTREILNEYIEILNKIIGSEHEHDVYITKEIMEGLYLTKKEFNTIDFSEKIDLSNHVSKEELKSFNYLTASYDGFCTLTDANKKLDNLKSYIADTLKKYALKSDLDLIKDFLNRLEIRIKNLETDNERIIEEIEALKAIVICTIQYEIDKNITNTNNITVIEEGKTYSTVLTSNVNYQIGTVQVLMNNVDITAQCVSKTNTKAMIDIPNVTGPIIIRAYALLIYSITKNIPNCSITNTNDRIAHGSRYYAQIAANFDYVIINATLTMGGENVSNMYMSNTEVGGLEIDIPNVTGNIVITVEAIRFTCDSAMNLELGTTYKTGRITTYKEGYFVPYEGGFVTSDKFTFGCVRMSDVPEGASVVLSSPNLAIYDVVFVDKAITNGDWDNYFEGNWVGDLRIERRSYTITSEQITQAKNKGAQAIFLTFITYELPGDGTGASMNISYEVKTANEEKDVNMIVDPLEMIEDVTWMMSTENVVSIKKVGTKIYIQAISKGTCHVTFYCSTAIASCDVTVGTMEETMEEYQITYYLVGGVASDEKQTVYHGESYYTEVTVTESTLEVINYQLTMDGIDVTSQYMSVSSKKVTVNIPYVTGHINIRVEAKKRNRY